MNIRDCNAGGEMEITKDSGKSMINVNVYLPSGDIISYDAKSYKINSDEPGVVILVESKNEGRNENCIERRLINMPMIIKMKNEPLVEHIPTPVCDKHNDNEIMNIFEAVNSGIVENVKKLIKSGVNVNVKSKYGWTPLHFAVWNRNLDMVKFLVEQGADIKMKDDDGRTPLYVAEREVYIDIVTFLKEHGGNYEQK